MTTNFRDVAYHMIKLPILLIGYISLVLLTILLPKKYVSRLFSMVHLERDITEIINNNRYLKTFAFLLTVVIYSIYRLS